MSQNRNTDSPRFTLPTPHSATLPPHIAALGPALQDLLTVRQVEGEYGIPAATQYAWGRENRHGWGDLLIHLGRSLRIRRLDLLLWFESRKAAKGGEQ